ncbi:MAG: hypothetical protein ACLPND_02705 [Candidatus Korobacteraceae bacterium]|jgi:hypothetical protein
MRATRQLEFSNKAACLREAWRRSACLLVVLGAALSLPAQDLPPPWLEPTANALAGIKQCGKTIAKSAPDISSKLFDAQRQLTSGLLKGGYANEQAGYGEGYNRGGKYNRQGGWLLNPPPKEYVEDLSHEARWCVEVANVLNTQPNEKEAALKVLESIASDLHIKVVDCRAWGAGRLITVIASTVKNGQPDPGWTVMYKWVSVSGLNSAELSFPQESTPTSKAVPPGMYSLYATKQVGGTLEKTQPVTVSAFQDAKVKCEIPVP